MTHLTRPILLILLLVSLVIPTSVFAALEFIPLRHTPPEDIIPMIQPFLSDGETVIAGRNELIVKASPKSMDSIRQIVAKYDVPLEQLMIYVRVNNAADQHRQGIDGHLNAQIGTRSSEHAVQGQVRIYQKHSTKNRNQEQFIRVIEGRPAYISYGTNTPTTAITIHSTPPVWTLSEHTEYHEDTEGFVVTPRLVGEQVLLEIDQWSSQRGHHDGSPHQVSRASSSIRAPLDQWVSLGGIEESGQQDQRSLLGKRSSSREQQRSIEVKIRRSNPSR